MTARSFRVATRHSRTGICFSSTRLPAQQYSRSFKLLTIEAGKPASSESTHKGFPAGRVRPAPREESTAATLQWEHGFSKRALLTSLCSHVFLFLLTRYGPAAAVTAFHHCNSERDL